MGLWFIVTTQIVWPLRRVRAGINSCRPYRVEHCAQEMHSTHLQIVEILWNKWSVLSLKRVSQGSMAMAIHLEQLFLQEQLGRFCINQGIC